jgi:hypothetical protein
MSTRKPDAQRRADRFLKYPPRIRLDKPWTRLLPLKSPNPPWAELPRHAVLIRVGLRLSAGFTDFAGECGCITAPQPTTEPTNQRPEVGHAPIMRLCAASSEVFRQTLLERRRGWSTQTLERSAVVNR